MPYHSWGDDWPYWDDLYKAEKFISDYVKKYSRCNIMMKEKYGTLRYSAIFPPYTGYSIRPNWIDKILHLFGKKTIVYEIQGQTRYYERYRFRWYESSLCRLWGRFGKYVFSRAIKKAIKKWPHIKDEILDDYDLDFIGYPV